MINFEEDQAKVITKTENIQSLADQVERLENLNQEIENAEKDFEVENLDKEVIADYKLELKEREKSNVN